MFIPGSIFLGRGQAHDVVAKHALHCGVYEYGGLMGSNDFLNRTFSRESLMLDASYLDNIMKKATNINPAKWTYERIVKEIDSFEAELSSDEEIGARFVSTPGSSVFHIEDLGFLGPDLIIFYGTNEHRRPIQLIQHYTQISILLTAIPKISEQPRRIGFDLAKRLQIHTNEAAEPDDPK